MSLTIEKTLTRKTAMNVINGIKMTYVYDIDENNKVSAVQGNSQPPKPEENKIVRVNTHYDAASNAIHLSVIGPIEVEEKTIAEIYKDMRTIIG